MGPTSTACAPDSCRPAPYVTIPVAAAMTGLTEKAIRRKMEDGKWIEGRSTGAPRRRHLPISIKGFTSWVEADLS